MTSRAALRTHRGLNHAEMARASFDRSWARSKSDFILAFLAFTTSAAGESWVWISSNQSLAAMSQLAGFLSSIKENMRCENTRLYTAGDVFRTHPALCTLE